MGTLRSERTLLLDSLQQVISCVTDQVLANFGGYYVTDTPHTLVLANGRLVGLPGGRSIALFIRQQYLIAPDRETDSRQRWSIQITSNAYALHDAGGSEIITYH